MSTTVNVQVTATPQTLSSSLSQLAAAFALSNGPLIEINMSIALNNMAQPTTPAGQATRPASTGAPRPPLQPASSRTNRQLVHRVALSGDATPRSTNRLHQHDSCKWTFCSRCHIKRRHMSRWWNRPYRH